MHKIMSTENVLNEEKGNGVLADVMLSLPDIRNKLSPIKNLIAMLENGLVKGTIEVHPLILKEIEQCKKSIAYLSGNGA
jgi:hypothetical protein